MKKFFILFYGILICTTYLLVYAQQTTPRTLEECIAIALKNNPLLKQNELETKRAAVQLSQAKANRLPDLNADWGHSLSTGRFLDQSVNQYTTQNNSSGAYSVNASVPLFNGFRILHNIRMKNDEQKAADLTYESRKNALKLDVIEAYIEVLTAKDIVKQATLQREVTQEQVRRAEILQQEGAINPGDYYDLKGQLANDHITIDNQNQLLFQSRIKLSNLLDMDEAQLGEIESLSWNEDGQRLPANQLLQLATQRLPDIPALNQRISAAEQNIKVSKAAYWPSLSLNAGLYSNFSNTMHIGYFDQLHNNIGKSVSINLRIPVFNRLATYNQVRLAKLDLESARLDKEVSLNSLRKETASAVFNLENASKNMEQLRLQHQSYAESFRIARVQFEAGNSNSVLFLTAKNKLDNTQIQLLIKQYEWLLQKYINRYYAGTLEL